MIADWRAKWSLFSQGQTDNLFPFGFVIIGPNFDRENATCGNNTSSSCTVAVVRWGQTANYGYVPNPVMENTFMAAAIDWGDPDSDPNSPIVDLHPRYKRPVAIRLAKAGLAVAYGYDYYWTGPIAGLLIKYFLHIFITA